MLYYRLVTFLRWLVQSPEWQTGKKDKRRPNAVVPVGLVYVDFHLRSLSLFFFPRQVFFEGFNQRVVLLGGL